MESSYEVGAVAKDKDSEINEAKKHLTEMPDTGDQRACVSESLGSHGSDKELVLPYEETASLPVQQFHQEDATSSSSLLNQSLELSPHSSGDQTDAPMMLDSKAEITDNHMQEGFCMGSELNLEGAQQARFNYVKAVIEASGLSATDFSGRCRLGDELLARSLFDEVEISSSPQIDDPKLLFDCISEALEEIFKRPPRVSLSTSNVQRAPVAQSLLIREVSRRIERQISMRSPNPLGQMVTKDLERGSLLDLHSETRNIVDEIWDTLLDDLVDETIFDLWLDL